MPSLAASLPMRLLVCLCRWQVMNAMEDSQQQAEEQQQNALPKNRHTAEVIPSHPRFVGRDCVVTPPSVPFSWLI